MGKVLRVAPRARRCDARTSPPGGRPTRRATRCCGLHFVLTPGRRSPFRYAVQLEELIEELFSESATLYDEYGVPLQDWLREVNRHLRAHRLLAAGQTLRPVEKMITQACLSQRDEQERQFQTTALFDV